MIEEDRRVIEIETKVSRLESAVENTQNSIRSLAESTEKQISNLAATTEHQIERLAITINKMSEHQFSSQKTNWSQIWTAAGVMVVLFGSLIGGFILSPQAKMQQEIIQTKDIINSHMANGHPDSVIAAVREVDKDVVRLLEWRNKYFPILIALEQKVEGNTLVLNRLESKIDEFVPNEQRIKSLERKHYGE